MRAAVIAVLLVVGACGGDDASETTTTPAPTAEATTTSAAASTPSTTVTAAPATTPTTVTPTTTTSTTTTTVTPSPGALALTRIVFEPSSYIVITNVGGESAELDEHWLCVFPSYRQLPTQTLGPGESVALGLDNEPPPDLVDFVAVFELGPVVGTPQSTGGELGLYTAAEFGSATAIIDYVEWGTPGHERSTVAVDAGIWSQGAFIEIPEEAFAISSSGAVGANEADWFVDLGG